MIIFFFLTKVIWFDWFADKKNPKKWRQKGKKNALQHFKFIKLHTYEYVSTEIDGKFMFTEKIS